VLQRGGAVSVDVVEMAHRVSEESSLIVVYLTIAELLPAAIVVLILGSWSDATGRRKFLMWLPCVGNALYALGFLLPWYISAADIDRSSTMTLFVVGSVRDTATLFITHTHTRLTALFPGLPG